MKRRFGDVLISAGDLAVLLFIVLAINDRARLQVVRLAQGTSTEVLGDAGERLSGLTSGMYLAANHLSFQHEAMMLMVAVAAVLTVLMVRT